MTGVCTGKKKTATRSTTSVEKLALATAIPRPPPGFSLVNERGWTKLTPADYEHIAKTMMELSRAEAKSHEAQELENGMQDAGV